MANPYKIDKSSGKTTGAHDKSGRTTGKQSAGKARKNTQGRANRTVDVTGGLNPKGRYA